MKLLALALDFDGTIAHNDVVEPDVRHALAEMRSRGVTVILVTGRILNDLRRVAGDLHFVDAVVAENGAVIAFPVSGYESLLASPVPPQLIDELRREGISCGIGQSVVDIHRDDASRVLGMIARLELPLTLVFNRSRVMILPQAVSKATGLRRALAVLRLSEHNTVGIGDAENDHELLRVCETAVAVAWGSEALKALADFIIPGDGPPAVAHYIRGLTTLRRVPRSEKARRSLLLGHTDDGHPLSLAIRGRNVLVTGDPESGKSWVAGLLCEQLLLYGYSLCILDAEGDYASLVDLPGVVIYGGADPLPRIHELLRTLRHSDVSVVVDLSHAMQDDKLEYIRHVLPALAAFRQRTGLPHRIVVDEADHFLDGTDIPGLLDLELGGYTLVTDKAAKVHPELLAATEAIITTRQSDPNEIRGLRSLCGSCHAGEEWANLLGSLVVGQAVVLPITREAEGELWRIRLTPRLTPHVRHLTKYIDVSVPASKAFFFGGPDGPTSQRAHTFREFVHILENPAGTAVDRHLKSGDFSNWIRDVFGDYSLALAIQQIEGDYRSGISADAVARLIQAVRARYEFLDSRR